MIWLLIASAIILSVLPLAKKQIPLPLYMWIFLPVDAYGLTIAGTVVKPYMIFALLLPFFMYAQNKSKGYDLYISKGELVAVILCCMMITISLFNSDSSYSIKVAVMALVVYICAQVACAATSTNSISRLSDVMISSCFGYGVVFIIAYICFNLGINIPDLIANTRESTGVFIQLNNMLDGSFITAYRLRGFFYDPNTMYIPFLFGLSACVLKMFKKPTLYNVITTVICITIIVMSSSRMGVICAGLCFVVSSIIGARSFNTARKKVMMFVVVLTLTSAFVALFATNQGEKLLSSLISSYTNRSGLNDNYGRFSIWREAMTVFWNTHPLAGVGLGNLSSMTHIQRMSHNTWLELICECGIFVGVAVVLYFFVVMIIGWVRSKHRTQSCFNTSYYALLIGYTTMLVALFSVDNFASCYLWFGALMVIKASRHSSIEADALQS